MPSGVYAAAAAARQHVTVLAANKDNFAGEPGAVAAAQTAAAAQTTAAAQTSAAAQTIAAAQTTTDTSTGAASPTRTLATYRSTTSCSLIETNMATFWNKATQTTAQPEPQHLQPERTSGGHGGAVLASEAAREITPLQLMEMIEKLNNMLSVGADHVILKVRDQALLTLDLCFKQCCEGLSINEDHPSVRDADLDERIAPKGDPGTSTAPCGREKRENGNT